MKRLKKALWLMGMCTLVAVLTLGVAACKKPADDPGGDPGGDPGDDPNPPVVTTVYGLPAPETGHYIKDADLVEDGAVRYLTYVTNEESGEEDNVVAVRKASFTEGKGWAYGAETIALKGSADGWDAYIGSASMVKGSFTYNENEYGWLIAYCATDKADDTQFKIGLAAASTPDGTWVKVGETPIVDFDPDVYGASGVGCYAPSIVNLDKTSKVRLFYTYADMYGHFARFVDLNAADLNALYTPQAASDPTLVSGAVQVPTGGNLSGGDAETMFPNADWAYDAAAGKFYAVKDYSPSAGTVPMYAEKIELAVIAEAELYTAEILDGWSSLRVWDSTDTPDMLYERLYGGSIVTDAYGHMVSGAIEIVYSVCAVEADDADWMFTQHLETFTVERE